MNTLQEIEKAIEHLPLPLMEELMAWLDQRRSRPVEQLAAETWLKRARGAAMPGTTTASVMALTRGEE